MSLHFFRVAEPKLTEISTQAQTIVQNINNEYPPNASGLWRILPWNWSIEPITPKGTEESFSYIQSIKNGIKNPYLLCKDLAVFDSLPLSTSREQIVLLQEKIITLRQYLPHLSGKYYFYYPASGVYLIPILLALVGGFIESLDILRSRKAIDTSDRIFNTIFTLSTLFLIAFSLRNAYFDIEHLLIYFFISFFVILGVLYLYLWAFYLRIVIAEENPSLTPLKRKFQKIGKLNRQLISAVDDLKQPPTFDWQLEDIKNELERLNELHEKLKKLST